MTIDRLSLLVGKPRGFSVLDDGSGRNRPEPKFLGLRIGLVLIFL